MPDRSSNVRQHCRYRESQNQSEHGHGVMWPKGFIVFTSSLYQDRAGVSAPLHSRFSSTLTAAMSLVGRLPKQSCAAILPSNSPSLSYKKYGDILKGQ